MPEAESSDLAHGVGAVIDGPLQAFFDRVGASWGSMSLLRSTELWKSAVSAGDRATGPLWYSGVRQTGLRMGLSSRSLDGQR